MSLGCLWRRPEYKFLFYNYCTTFITDKNRRLTPRLYLRHAVLRLLDVLEFRPVRDEIGQRQSMHGLVLLSKSALTKDLHVRVTVGPLEQNRRRRHVRRTGTHGSIARQLHVIANTDCTLITTSMIQLRLLKTALF